MEDRKLAGLRLTAMDEAAIGVYCAWRKSGRCWTKCLHETESQAYGLRRGNAEGPEGQL